MSDLRLLVSSRKAIRKKVTDCFNSSGTYSSLDSAHKLSTKNLLLSYKKSLIETDAKIHDIKLSKATDAELDDELLACQDYLDKIEFCLPLLDVLSNPTNVTDTARSLLKQPTAPLPKFKSLVNEDFLRFLSEFESTTSAFSYPDRDLLLLLKQQVEGRAKTLLSSLEADKQTYNDAKQLLITAFASEETRKLSTIKELTSLRLNPEDDPFTYISRLRTICESVKVLKITSDDFLQYFAWLGLDENFKKELVQITTKTRPSIKEILDNFFVSCERYENAKKLHMKPSKNANTSSKFPTENKTSFAIKVNSVKSNAIKNCSICSRIEGKDVMHAIYKCSKFPTPQQKLDKLKSLNGCTKCGNFSHYTDKCTFRFKKKCYHCSGWHFSFLCIKAPSFSRTDREAVHSQPNRESAASVSDKADITSGVVVFPNLGNDSVLPTFTFRISGHESVFRGLKDSGSQSSFISRRLYDLHRFETLKDDVSLSVTGFNGTKCYKSKVVKIPIILGDCTFSLSAMVVPDINISLNLTSLGTVVEGFHCKGYKFADSMLTNTTQKVGNIEMLLGSDAAHCLLGKDIMFGEDSPSIFIESHAGVMLVGNIRNLIDNLPHLPFASNMVYNMNPSTSAPLHSSTNVTTHSFLCSDFIVPSLDNEIRDIDYEGLNTDCNFSVLSNKGKLIESKLQKATEQILETECRKFINYDETVYEDETMQLNTNLIDFTLKNISRDNDGRVRVPLLWNGKVSHLLSKNETLAKVILKSNMKKLKNNHDYLLLMDQTIKDQVSAGIIEPVHNLDQYKAEHPEYSFLPHMGIFKPDRETTKCRVVFLSNLREADARKKLSLSHNQCIHPGPTLNQKLSSAFLHLRFDKKLLTYDLKKAFNMLSLGQTDQSKLLFFWFRNVQRGDFSIVAYKNVRLSFGLRCSPFLLMIALYYILVLEPSETIDIAQLKQLMYALLYMDNGAVTANDSSFLEWAYSQLPKIFAPYGFDVQQLITNDTVLQDKIDDEMTVETPATTKLFGLIWDRFEDEIYTRPINLNSDANTKRTILKSIAGQFDIYGFNLPLLNRSRLFMHRLQCQNKLGWDHPISLEQQQEWKNICKQANKSSLVKFSRYVGPREGNFRIVAFTDASNVLYGTVIYIQDLDSGKLSFLQAKNRMVNTQLKTKSIPSLEMNAICLGVETLMEIYRDLAGPSCMKPINISELLVFTDSLCSLHWLIASSYKMEKMQKRTVFVMNRINHIQKLCEHFPVRFCFIPGKDNPSDSVTRCLSHKQLLKSSFLSNTDVSIFDSNFEGMSIIIPNPLTLDDDAANPEESEHEVPSTSLHSQVEVTEHILDPDDFSSFRKLVLLHRRVLACIHKWKLKAGITCNVSNKVNFFAEATKRILLTEQRKNFSDLFSYFEKGSILKDIPLLITQLNVYVDELGLLRVKSKFRKWLGKDNQFPILLPRNSTLTELIVLDAHSILSHSGAYSVLSELRNYYYISRPFSTIKKILKQCVHCKRFNNGTFRLNQNSYREFRSDPPSVPFSNVFIDHIGPFTVKVDNKPQKVWLLCIACTWTRAINLKICKDLSVKEFLRSFQLHCMEFGIPQLCVSDLGSQLTAGANIITNFINDYETQLYFESNNVQPLTFQQYFKGCSKLGSLVETCVKMVKRLLFGSIKNHILSFPDFEYIVCHTVHLSNRRPIAFKESLRDGNLASVPEPITPELMIKGYELTSLNLIPELQSVPDVDPDWLDDSNPSQQIKDEFMKLRKVRNTLREKYHSEFLGTLISQAVDKKDRYRPVTQQRIKVGDLVLLKDVHTKPNNYPMGLVKEIEFNSNNEATGAVILKGKTKELVKRHITTLIPLLECDSILDNPLDSDIHTPDQGKVFSPRVRRKAAVNSEKRTRLLFNNL